MKTFRTFLTVVLVFAVVALTGGIAHGQQLECLPGIGQAFLAHPAAYSSVLTVLQPQVSTLTSQLSRVVDQGTYQILLTNSRAIAATIPNGRIVITLPDGTVVLDTARPDDVTNVMPQGNSYQHFVSKTVNENHNTRVAIFSAQQYPCGVGIEAKISTTTGNTETYVALRLGPHLNSEGTVRGSTF